MKLNELLSVIRDSTRIQLKDEKGASLTAPLHKRDLTDRFNDMEVTNICARYLGNGHTVRFYLCVSLK